MPKKIDEKELLLRITKGDTKAFDALFKLYFKRLTDFVNLIVENNFVAEDIVSQFFTDIWLKRRELTNITSVRSYFFISIKNRAISYLRKSKKNVEEYLNQSFEISGDCNPEKKIIIQEEKDKVDNILNLIPPKSRQVFILHRFEGFKYREIAELLNISPKTVENHIVKAMKILRDYYANSKS